jgi:hypothetical protein
MRIAALLIAAFAMLRYADTEMAAEPRSLLNATGSATVADSP